MPDSVNLKMKQIKGRDYMNIKDIPGVNPNPNFILYKSKHKDLKMDISDIIEKPMSVKLKNMIIPKNPLEPQYVRMTESRRHVQVYGDIDGGRPKRTIAPQTRRQTNMTSDIIGPGKKLPPSFPSNPSNSIRGAASTHNSTRLNPITGEEYAVRTNYPKPVSFLKVNHAEKSRRLARILHKFKSVNDHDDKSRSPEKNFTSPMASDYHTNQRHESSPLDKRGSKRITLNMDDVRSAKNKSAIYSSEKVKPAVLPSFSKRKLGHNKDDFSAYEDIVPKSKPTMSRRSRHNLHDGIPKVSQSFAAGVTQNGSSIENNK